MIIYFFLILGYFFRRQSCINNLVISILNNLIIYFFLPLITLLHIPRIHFSLDFIWLSISPFIVYIGSILYFSGLRKVADINPNMVSVLIMTCGISSISFVGFPLFEMMYGAEGLSMGIVQSVLGTLVVFNTLGLLTAIYRSDVDSAINVWHMLKKVITFPTFVAFVLALLLNLNEWQLPTMAQDVMSLLVLPYTPLAFFTIGTQIHFTFDFAKLKPILYGLSYKLFLAPLIIYLIVWVGMGNHSLISKICILGSAIGSMNAVSILAAKMKLEPDVALLMPAISIPISIPIVIFINHLLS